jgi:hypothetical protein
MRQQYFEVFSPMLKKLKKNLKECGNVMMNSNGTNLFLVSGVVITG